MKSGILKDAKVGDYIYIEYGDDLNRDRIIEITPFGVIKTKKGGTYDINGKFQGRGTKIIWAVPETPELKDAYERKVTIAVISSSDWKGYQRKT